MIDRIQLQSFSCGEQRWLNRFGWLFPVLGLPLGIGIGGGLWGGILLQSSFLPARPVDWITLKGVALGLCFACLPIVWRLGILIEEKIGPSRNRWPIAPILGLLAVILAEIIFHSYFAQSILWQAVRARAGDNHMAREISLLRESAALPQSAETRKNAGLVIVGSSQMVFGTDIPQLMQLTGLPVYRRAVAGLFPTELVASQEFFDFNPENRLILFLSGFVLGAREDLYPNAIRPLSTIRGMRHLTSATPAPLGLQHWRSYIDLHIAARCDLWRSRDYARFLLENPFSPYRHDRVRHFDLTTDDQQTAYAQLGSNPQMTALCKASLNRFFMDMSTRCREMIVFEGRVNPAYPSPGLASMSAEMRCFLKGQDQLGYIRYVPIEEQNLELPESMWRDMTHVNPEGRKCMTHMLARILSSPAPS